MDYRRADDPLFGKYCYIDTPWIAGKHTIYRIIRSGVRSNSWCEVPVNGRTEKVNHGKQSEDIVFVVLDTLIDEDTKIKRFALKDIEIIEMADRKTENSSEKPNNCEHITEDGVTCAKYPACDDCLDNPLNKVKGSERLVKGKDEPQTCKWGEWYRKGYDITMMDDECGGCCSWNSKWKPKDEPQEKEVEWVYNKRERLWYPYSNGEPLFKDEPTTQMKTQNSNLTFEKDEYAKEYEELGLKELKELIEADRKTESNSEKPNNCEDCKWWFGYCHLEECEYEPKDESQTEAEIAKAIVHKAIDDAVIAEDAYSDLRQKMHDAVDEYETQTDCAWK